ncbi:MAG: glycosyltransferase family 2 protein [Nitrospinota bacterium]|nr:glycosyltransferase family 2 protein [Nitrospinota bacterium]
MSQSHPITVGVINYNGADIIENTLRSIYESGHGGPLEVVVVDDCSTDQSPGIIRDKFPGVRLVIQPANAGPNAARNQVLAHASHPFVFISDNDVELAPDCLSLLVERLTADPDTAVTTPMVLDFHQRDQVYSNGAGLHYVCFGIIGLRHEKMPEDLSMEPFTSICGSGGIMMVRKEVALALGGFDEDFIFGYDDGEFTYRVSASGRRVEQVPAARIYHLEKPGRNPKRLRYQIRGRWTLILKAYSTRSLILLAPALLIFEAAQVVFLFSKGQAGEWLAGVGMVNRSRGAIMEKRRAVMAAKKTPDNKLLAPGEIFMFPSRVGSRVMKMAKGAMETGLDIYWWIVGPFLTR